MTRTISQYSYTPDGHRSIGSFSSSLGGRSTSQATLFRLPGARLPGTASAPGHIDVTDVSSKQKRFLSSSPLSPNRALFYPQAEYLIALSPPLSASYHQPKRRLHFSSPSGPPFFFHLTWWIDPIGCCCLLSLPYSRNCSLRRLQRPGFFTASFISLFRNPLENWSQVRARISYVCNRIGFIWRWVLINFIVANPIRLNGPPRLCFQIVFQLNWSVWMILKSQERYTVAWSERD